MPNVNALATVSARRTFPEFAEAIVDKWIYRLSHAPIQVADSLVVYRDLLAFIETVNPKTQKQLFINATNAMDAIYDGLLAAAVARLKSDPDQELRRIAGGVNRLASFQAQCDHAIAAYQGGANGKR